MKAVEHLKVYKMLQSGYGMRKFVGDYPMSCLHESGCDNIEAFIKKHIVPLFGIGRYEITGVTSKGQELDVGEVVIEVQRPLKVYVAGPLFSSGLIDDNIRKALEVGHQIKELGAIPVIPHLFFFWDLIFPRGEEYWLELDRWLVQDSDITFRLEGYSKGANDEEGWSKQIFRSKRELFDYIMSYNLRVYGKKYGDRSFFRCMKIQMERGEDDQG